MRLFCSVVLLLFSFPALGFAQQTGDQLELPCMPGMTMLGCAESAKQQTGQNFIEKIQHPSPSERSAEPGSTRTPIWITIKGNWMVMFHAKGFDVIPHLTSAIGGQFTTSGVADALKPIYSSHPVGTALFVRLRPVSGPER